MTTPFHPQMCSSLQIAIKAFANLLFSPEAFENVDFNPNLF